MQGTDPLTEGVRPIKGRGETLKAPDPLKWRGQTPWRKGWDHLEKGSRLNVLIMTIIFSTNSLKCPKWSPRKVYIFICLEKTMGRYCFVGIKNSFTFSSILHACQIMSKTIKQLVKYPPSFSFDGPIINNNKNKRII